MKEKLSCLKCKSSKIKTKVNYPFGKQSKGVLTKANCKSCGRSVI